MLAMLVVMLREVRRWEGKLWDHAVRRVKHWLWMELAILWELAILLLLLLLVLLVHALLLEAHELLLWWWLHVVVVHCIGKGFLL